MTGIDSNGFIICRDYTLGDGLSLSAVRFLISIDCENPEAVCENTPVRFVNPAGTLYWVRSANNLATTGWRIENIDETPVQKIKIPGFGLDANFGFDANDPDQFVVMEAGTNQTFPYLEPTGMSFRAKSGTRIMYMAVRLSPNLPDHVIDETGTLFAWPTQEILNDLTRIEQLFISITDSSTGFRAESIIRAPDFVAPARLTDWAAFR